MIALNLPLLMVGAFLLFTLAVGLHFSRKTTTLREYAVGHKKFATATLVATVLATTYGGGGLIRDIQQIHNLGLHWVLFSIMCIGLWIIIPIAGRMAPFMKHLSMAETMGSIYGRVPRVITALSGIAASIATLAIQINVIALTISMCADSINPNVITIIATLVLIAYSTFGGIRAVTYTDVLQFVTFTVVIPILVWFMFQKVGKPVADIIPFLQTQEKFQFRKVFSWNTSLVAMISLNLSGLVCAIEPPTMQRVYMASGIIQAKKVFLYSGILSFFIDIFIILTGIAVFVGAPELQIENIWGYIMDNIPIFLKGLVCISLLAMTMSTADSELNACSVMISHDMVESIRGKHAAAASNNFWLTRLTSIIVGLSAMVLAFYCTDLLELLKLAFDFSIPVVTAPFILAIFGFRGTSKTALIGMATGTGAIIAWNIWIEPATEIDGAFVCMLANGLAMMAAHYFRPQPHGTGWMEEDDEQKQRRQAKEREKARKKEAAKQTFLNKEWEKLKPTDANCLLMSFYVVGTTLLSLVAIGANHFTAWYALRLIAASCFFSYGMSQNKLASNWMVGKYWFIGLVFVLPADTIFHWWNSTNLMFTLFLSFAHLAFTLCMLSFYWSIPVTVVASLMVAYPIYRLGVTSFLQASSQTPPMLLMFGVVLLFMIIYHKMQLNMVNKKVRHLELQKKKQEEEELKEIAYTLNITQKPVKDVVEEDGRILESIVGNVTQSISFLDNKKPLYKEDFQSILNKFADWAAFLKRKSKSKDHLLLLPTETTIGELISKMEVGVEAELGKIPRILVYREKWSTITMVCDVDKVVDLLVAAILKITNRDTIETDMIYVRLSTASLAYHKCDDVKDRHPRWYPFPAIAMLISNYNTPLQDLPEVKSCYNDTNPLKISFDNNVESTDPIELSSRNMHRTIRAHYGYLELPKPDKNGIIIVLPRDVNVIRYEMISKLPIDLLTSESPITPKEQADSLVALMEFHEYVCEVARVESAVISEILLLLRRCYGFKRHASGQLFYVRATGIARLLAKWIFHSPKPIYASLLYDLVRYTHLSLSYIKANYNFGIFCFVQRALSVDKHQDIERSLLYVNNRFQDLVTKEQLSILYIKLAERLYDLRNAAGYENKEEVKSMAKETLAIDIELAKKYLYTEPEIANALEAAAKDALEVCNI